MKISQWEGSNFALIAFERENIVNGPAAEQMIPVVREVLNSTPWCVSLDRIADRESPWDQLPDEFVNQLIESDYDKELTFLSIYGNEMVLNSIVDFGVDLETLVFSMGEDADMKDMFENDRTSWDRMVKYLTLLNQLRGARITQMVDAAYAAMHEHHDHDHDHHHHHHHHHDHDHDHDHGNN